MDTEKYKNFTTDDFILDDNFREIVSKPGSNILLREFIENFPEKESEIILAVKLIQNLYAGEFQQSEIRKNSLWNQIVEQQNRKKRFLYFRYAASFLLFVGISSVVYFVANRKQAEQVVVTELPVPDALLILADGKTMSISSKQSTIQYSADGSGIIVDSAGVVQHISSDGVNQMIVPYGKRSFITLSEGTKVWMNSGSRLVFPPAFKGETREVILEGEAFFDVAHDAQKPFFVKTDAFTMKVYGTKFNVQAYTQDQSYNIVLVEGKVGMNLNENLASSEVFLAPNQKALITKGEKTFDISEVENMEVYTAWMDGYLTFTNEDISVLLKKVSRYYNVDIEIDLPENWEKIYGKLDLKEDFERVLDGIAFISKTRYEKRDNKYIFFSNNE